jgi:dihydropteroate synthase
MIVRHRSYASLSGAREEWRRLGLSAVAEDEADLFGSLYFFAEGTEEEQVADLAFATEDLGGDAWRCDTPGVFRALVEFEPEVLRPSCCAPSHHGALDAVHRTLALYRNPATPKIAWNGGELDLSSTKVMGVLNVTPDSFSDGGQHLPADMAVRRALAMAEQGADIIDVGGESTRPSAEPVPIEVEKGRILGVIEELASRLSIPISVDTRHAEVAEAALNAGAAIINDVGGLRDVDMMEVAARRGAPVIMMHMQGDPRSMQRDPRYADVVGDICLFFDGRLSEAQARGVDPRKVVVDPGIGFGKTVQHNLDILRRLREFSCLGRPIMVGASRKGFIGKLLGTAEGQRLEGSLAAAAMAIMNGASVVRCHDVLETRRVVQVVDAVRRENG